MVVQLNHSNRYANHSAYIRRRLKAQIPVYRYLEGWANIGLC